MASSKDFHHKGFGLSNLSLRNQMTVLLVTAMTIIFGIESYITLPKDSFPDINMNQVYVGTPYPGNSPVDIENLITRPLEKEINTIAEVDKITSITVQDYSTIIVEFPPEMETEEVFRKVKDAVDKAKNELPTDLDNDPNVFEFDFGQLPILNINLAGDYSIEALNDYAEILKDHIERIAEIAKVEIRGVDTKEVQILVDPIKMNATEVSFKDIENAVSAENVTMSGGSLLQDSVRRSIRVVGEFKEAADVGEIVIKREKNKIVHLKDIAEITFDYPADKSSYARLNTQPVVSVDVTKRSGKNLLAATSKVYDTITACKELLPNDLEMRITNDQSDYTRKMVNSLENNIISGIILVVLTLQFFLGTRNALFAGIAIPMSMFLSFCTLALMGATVNMMVLFSLIMSLGMLVDNAIVVVENCYRLVEAGRTPLQAAKEGVGEVALPIISSTFTTLSAFLPLALWPGLMGEFMRYLPITLIITLSSSLFVALVINPVVISFLMKNKELPRNKKKLWRNAGIFFGVGMIFLLANGRVAGNLSLLAGGLLLLNSYVLNPFSNKFRGGALPLLEQSYERLLSFALSGKRPYFFFSSTVFLLFFSVVLLSIFTPKVLFFPENQPKYINVFIEHPVGTDIEESNRFAAYIEDEVLAVTAPYRFMVNSVMSKVGAGASDPNDLAAFNPGETPEKSLITVDFKDFEFRKGVNTSKVMEEIRQALGGHAGVSVVVDKNRDGPPVGKAISIEITGDEFAVLIETAESMRAYINRSGIGGIESLKVDLQLNKPELLVSVDKEKARRYGLSTQLVASEIRTALFGKNISKFKEDEDEHDIVVRLADAYKNDPHVLLDRQITFRNESDGKLVNIPISSVVSIKQQHTYSTVNRKDLKRTATLSSNVLGEHNPTEVNNKIKALLATFNLPKEVRYSFGGEQEKQAEELSFLSRALLIAVFLILIIIIAQFNSFVPPIIIFTTVVFSLIGVLLGITLFNMDFIIMMTMIGIISLAGIVVNNGIVLLDFIEQRKKRRASELGLSRLPFEEVVPIIVAGSKIRLRPVLLTAITTILGLIPLAVGINIDFTSFLSTYDLDFYIGGDTVMFWSAMSWAIIFGLTFATFLTLIIVPVMYWFFEKLLAKPIQKIANS